MSEDRVRCVVRFPRRTGMCTGGFGHIFYHIIEEVAVQAVQATQQGDPDVLLVVDDVDRPEPEPDEVLVEVMGAGVNPIDTYVRRGEIPESMEAEFPWIPGWDVSGMVASTGLNVDSLSIGDPVYGMAQKPESGETYAEFTTMKVDEVQSVPEHISHSEAAALPMVSLTAHYALFEEGNLQSDETVLIHAAAGGVGHVGVQLAKNAGATVIGTASEYNQTYLDDLGVDEVVNYRVNAFEDEIDSVDLVIDAIGDDVLERSIELASPDGRVVTLPKPPSEEQQELAEEQSVECSFFSITTSATPDLWETVDELVREEVVTPTISCAYPLNQATHAHEEIEEGHVRGKLVLDLR